ncbi:MAG: putative membrane protein [Granulosicoccus sp.]|jgi:putative membrane protein
MNEGLSLFFKGLAMGAANVIPGVSGGTIALITGIYERLINAIKNCDLRAAKLLLHGDIKGGWRHIDGTWLAILLGGVAISIVSLARLFEYLLENHERYTMAFFFGLIVISIAFVAKRVNTWTSSTTASLIIGTVIAVSIAIIAPASENDHWLYVFICGVFAISSMILPGLSGSFVLILMGNYSLVLGAISSLSFDILIPLAVGCGFGLIAFSHIISWVFKRCPDQTLALMTGFVIGSLVVIWPWKEAVIEIVERVGKEPREVVTAYEWFFPQLQAPSTWIAIGLMVLGAAAIALMEKFVGGSTNS